MRKSSRAALSNGPTTEQSWTPQPRQWCLRENILKRGQNTMNRESDKEKRLRKSRATSKVREGGTNWPQGSDPCAAQGTMMEQITLQSVEAEQVDNPWRNYGPWRCQIGDGFSCRSAAHKSIHGGTRENREEEGAAEETCYRLIINFLLPILLDFLWGVGKSRMKK